MDRTEIMDKLRACDDVEAISDVALMAAWCLYRYR